MDIDTSSPFSHAFDYASDQVGLRFQNPLYQVTELFTGSKFRASIAKVKAFGQQIVANARQRQPQSDSDDVHKDSRWQRQPDGGSEGRGRINPEYN